VEGFIRGLPKVELHVHVEGTLEPEMMFAMAARNGVDLPFDSVDDLRAAYEFTDLQSFLDLYYQGAEVLQTQGDFRDLMAAYLGRVARDNVRHAEIFFDPQTHLARGIGFDTFMTGFDRARREAENDVGVTSMLIMCFRRDLTEEEAVATLEAALPTRDSITAVGLDSGERGNPPEKFTGAFAQARSLGLRVVAHAGEEGPPAYITGALDVLGAERIDHGVASEQDEGVLTRLVADRVPLTMCPLSNVRLRVFERMEDHNLKRLLDRGVRVTINSDDPAYFGGYLTDNYLAAQKGLGLTRDELVTIARNGIEASFAGEERKAALRSELEGYVGQPMD
jgi:adenosine deaminase